MTKSGKGNKGKGSATKSGKGQRAPTDEETIHFTKGRPGGKGYWGIVHDMVWEYECHTGKGPTANPAHFRLMSEDEVLQHLQRTSKALEEYESKSMMRRSNEDHYSLMASCLHNNQYGWGNCLNAHHSRKNRRLVQIWRDATNSLQYRPPTAREATLWKQRGWVQGALEPSSNSSAQLENTVIDTCPEPEAAAPEQAWTDHTAEQHHGIALQPPSQEAACGSGRGCIARPRDVVAIPPSNHNNVIGILK